MIVEICLGGYRLDITNYDYDYFNKLDELYEEMENQESEYEISDNDNY